jgi:radical SAM protein with 4Fe4S-binding SPASM domain
MVALWSLLVRDVAAFYRRVAPSRRPQPGLHTYRFEPPGGRRRVHLRIETDGRGVLFVDAGDVVHLNRTAAEMAKWALDGVTWIEAEATLAGRTGGHAREAWRSDLDAVYGLIGQLAEPTGVCPTCASKFVDHAPPFSTPVAAPYKADLAVTYKCNNSCPHCYNEPQRLDLESLPPDQWKKMIDRLCDVGVPHLIFTGGEPTLYPHLPDLIDHADRRGPICGLNTNGRRLAEAPYVDELVAAGLNHVQITLGSHRSELHDRMTSAGSFRQTVEGIENALASPLHTITNTTLMRMNADEIDQTVTFFHRLGVRTFAVNGMIHAGGGTGSHEQAIPEVQLSPLLIRIRDRAEELGMRFLWYTPTRYCRLSPLELELDAKRCNAAEYSICVEPNGDVLPCQSYYVAAGNMLCDPWERIWNDDLFRRFRQRIDEPQRHGLPEECWDCPDLDLCGGGCPLEREADRGVGGGLPVIEANDCQSHGGGRCSRRATGMFALY